MNRTLFALALLLPSLAFADPLAFPPQDDADGDGYFVGEDCDDSNDQVNPGAVEICGDGIDNDCSGVDDQGFLVWSDGDQDGYGTGAGSLTCQMPPDTTTQGGDCDDTNSSIYPGAPETCDGIDSNCDGFADDATTAQVPAWPDLDQDGFGDGTAVMVPSCAAGPLYVYNDSDCDDTNPTVNPNAPEVCDGQDNNCNSMVDEGAPVSTFYADLDGDGFGAGVGIATCSPGPGLVATTGDCDDSDPDRNPAMIEVCDGIDNDCDNAADVDAVDALVWFSDQDGDGFGSQPVSLSCSPAPGETSVDGDCDDTDSSIYPGAPEFCDGIDRDCDGNTNGGGMALSWWRDLDADGYGDASSAPFIDCAPPAGFVANNLDCDDAAADVSPGANEVCDQLDNDCDSMVDEGGICQCVDIDGNDTCDYDMDGDGYYDFEDCNDEDSAIHPGAIEVCDQVDNDCNDLVDELGACAEDADGDGFFDDEDCNDSDPTINPGASEVCDALDNDCDGQVDENNVCADDADGDGYFDDDCDDEDASVNPGALEVCDDGIDNDCDGQDEPCPDPETPTPTDEEINPSGGCTSAGVGGTYAALFLPFLLLRRPRRQN